MCTTLLSFMSSSLALAHIASITESASSSFLYNRSMHSSKSMLAVIQSVQFIVVDCSGVMVTNLEGQAWLQRSNRKREKGKV